MQLQEVSLSILVTKYIFRTDNSFLMIIAGKDKIVNNKGAQDFYRNTATPPDQKTLK